MSKIKIGCKQIIDYMKKNGFYSQYCRNVLNDNRIDTSKKSLRYKQHLFMGLMYAAGTSAINNNFRWGATPEGYEFWYEKSLQINRAFASVPLKYKHIIRKT